MQEKDITKYNIKVYKYNVKHIEGDEYEYLPAFAIVDKKIYPFDDWTTALKVIMYSYCYKRDNIRVAYKTMDIYSVLYDSEHIISKRSEESKQYIKFSPELYIKVYNSGIKNIRLLEKVKFFSGEKNFDVYFVKSDKNGIDLEEVTKAKDKYISKLRKNKGLKLGRTQHLVAYINGRIYNRTEKFYKYVEREFEHRKLLGDIDIGENEDILKQYMGTEIEKIISGNNIISHEKVFAYGLVYAALKNYSNKTFWPHIEREYGVKISAVYQKRINEEYFRILKKYGKVLYDGEVDHIQNICMHAFVCNKCLNQFYNYLFDFWRIDLSRNIENISDDNGNDLFNILIKEIIRNEYSNTQDIMLHTTLALKVNPIGCKNRIRRILKMIDNSYWNEQSFSDSKNRFVYLFEEWKLDKKSAYNKEIKRIKGSVLRTKGEKLLSSPTIIHNRISDSFALSLPKQILRDCEENEKPVWYIVVNEKISCVEPELLNGKIGVFTEKTQLYIDKFDIFKKIQVVLKSEKRVYYRRTIKENEVRFFDKMDRNVQVYNDYIPKEVQYAIVKKGYSLKYLNGNFTNVDTNKRGVNYYTINAKSGDILVLPNNQVVQIGKTFEEGLVGKNIVFGVKAKKNDIYFDVGIDLEQIYIKTDKKKFNGTSIKILKNYNDFYFGKVVDKKYTEFKMSEEVEEIYGYIIDLKDYIRDEGIYSVEISVPGRQVDKYDICYIDNFRFVFEGAPYIFEDYARIEFPDDLEIVTDENWDEFLGQKSLEFSLDEYGKEENPYVKNQKLCLNYKLVDTELELEFEIPALFWKYKKMDNWSIQRPREIHLKKLPKKIYFTGGLRWELVSFFIHDETEIQKAHIEYKDGLMCLKTDDLSIALNRKYDFREININIGDINERFVTVLCKSVIRSQSISGDLEKNKIFGNFDIHGSSDYIVTVKYGEEIVEEDIPLVNGKFELECEVKSGLYTIIVYEIEDDDGIDAVSYEIGRYDLRLLNINNLEGEDLKIWNVHSKDEKYNGLAIAKDYFICNLEKLSYKLDIKDRVELYSYLYDIDDERLISKFQYYKGKLYTHGYNNVKEEIGEILMILDNPKDISKALIYALEDNCCYPLLYNSNRNKLEVDEQLINKREKKYIKVLDDDLYEMCIEIKE